MANLYQDAYVTLQRAADRLNSDIHALLKPHGISPTQYNVLRILRGSGADGLACGEIGNRMIHREPDMTRLLDRIEKLGLIVRARGKADRRVVTAKITDAGLELLSKLDRPVLEAHERQFSGLGERKTRDLTRWLNLFLEDQHQ